MDELISFLETTANLVRRDLAETVRNRVAALLSTEPARALDLSKLLLRRIGTASDAAVAAIVWRAHAEANIYTGRLEMARKAYARATGFAELSGDRRLLGQILVGQIYVLGILGQELESSRLSRRAESLLTRERDDEYLRKLFINRASVLYHQERFEQARRAYRRVLHLFERAETEDATYAALCMNLAAVHSNLHRWSEAKAGFRLAETLADRLGLRFVSAHARFNRAMLERTLGNYRAALPLLAGVEEIFHREDARDMRAAALRLRAEIHLELGMVQDAIEGARSASATFRAEGMVFDACLSELTLGTALLRSAQPEVADRVFALAAEYFRTKHLQVRACRAEIDRAECALALGNVATARTRARRALRALAPGAAPSVDARGRIVMARVLLTEQRHAAAEREIKRALARRSTLSPSEQVQVWKEAAEVSRSSGRSGEARRRFQHAADALERHRSLVPSGDLRERAFDAGAGVYAALVETVLDGPLPTAEVLLDLTQKARARGFLERAATKGGGLRLDRQRVLLGSLGKRLEEKELSGANPKEISSLRRQVRNLEQEIARAKTVNEVPARRLGRVRPAQSSGRTIIAYYVAERRVLAFLLTPSGWQWEVLPGTAAELLEEVGRLTFQIDTFALSCVLAGVNLEFQLRTAQSILERLFALLVEPLVAKIPPCTELVFCPHAFLHLVPFECLYDGRRYIDERWAVSRVPSLIPLPKRDRGNAEGTLVCGTERPGLVAVRQEVEAVARLFPEATTRVHSNPETEALLEEMERCSTLHWCTHGSFRQDNPGFSSLATGDGSIYLSDLAERNLRAELVVLSACESGRVFLGRGDDLSGVAHGFLAAGAEQLVANQWRIREEATLTWIESFYRFWKHDRDAAQAARNAGRATREQWPHPYYWGGFILHRRQP